MESEMRKGAFHIVVLIGLLLFTGFSNADTPCAPFKDRVDPNILTAMKEAAVSGRLYRVNPDSSRVGFCVRHFPKQEFRGEFNNIVGGLAVPPDLANIGQALLLVHTTSLQSESKALIPLAKGSYFMNTTHYPEILYVGRRFEWITQAHAHIYGELTLRGVTKPVMFDADLHLSNDLDTEQADSIRLRGKSQINRFEYDMRSHRFFVSETIRLCVDVVLVPWNT